MDSFPIDSKYQNDSEEEDEENEDDDEEDEDDEEVRLISLELNMYLMFEILACQLGQGVLQVIIRKPKTN